MFTPLLLRNFVVLAVDAGDTDFNSDIAYSNRGGQRWSCNSSIEATALAYILVHMDGSGGGRG